MTESPDFHGPHIGPHRRDAELVDWREPEPRFDRVRIRRHTCDCKARILELCTAGGVAWVRKTDRFESGSLVWESRPLKTNEAEELWRKLLDGKAR
ncbi:hypothetical protein [Nonomuraea candida]|uniref:hypothetical protein n=1 Tax=Nonomuraea candida TaxID=359159 RepID=UPI0005BDFD2D|nr:hypothetical protein [Nonomuraea candida]